MMAKMAATRKTVHDDDGGGSVDNSALAFFCSLLAHVTASIAAVWITVRDKDGGRAGDGALLALLAIPCLLMQQHQ
jgi:hypothetical protein